MTKPQKGLILHNLAVKRGGGPGPDRPIPGSANVLNLRIFLFFLGLASNFFLCVLSVFMLTYITH